MTSSDLTLLPADAKERASTRVGTSVDGATGPGGVRTARASGWVWPAPSSTAASPTAC